MDFTGEPLGGWEPVYDPQLWERDGKLHLFYQPINSAGGGTMVSVLEFDPEVYFHSLQATATKR